MNTYSKPPMGCKPAWLVAENRISELAQAIDRSVECRDRIGSMRNWAQEILLQLEILENIKEDYPFT